ncbi:hypothetical protein ACOME3_003690 [Neoechinorhynchus agilis]
MLTFAVNLFVLLNYGFVAGYKYWDLHGPRGNLSVEDRIKMSPYVALVEVERINRENPQLYNASVTVKMGIKGNGFQDKIKIVNIERDVDSVCHTLLPNQQYVVFMEAIDQSTYTLKNFDQIEFNANDRDLIDRISASPGVNVAEIEYNHDSISDKQNQKGILKR